MQHCRRAADKRRGARAPSELSRHARAEGSTDSHNASWGEYRSGAGVKACYGQRAGGVNWQCGELCEWAETGRLAGAGAETAVDRQKDEFAGHQRGDTYLRTLLIHGARAVIRHAERKPEAQGWLQKLIGRRNKNVAAVALASTNAWIVWALLAYDR